MEDARAVSPRAALGTEEERVAVFRRVRDAIAARLRTWLAEETRHEMNV